MEKHLLTLHKAYNEIGLLQNGLPSKRGEKDYSEIEGEIIRKATSLKNECAKLCKKIAAHGLDTSDVNEIENIYSGADQIEKDPYKKIGGYRHL